jgi:hypothetical protein
MVLIWKDGRQLVLDLLSVHLIRHVDGSTIISFHPEIEHPTTTAEYLHERIRFAGGSTKLYYTHYLSWTRTKRVLAKYLPRLP